MNSNIYNFTFNILGLVLFMIIIYYIQTLLFYKLYVHVIFIYIRPFIWCICDMTRGQFVTSLTVHYFISILRIVIVKPLS